MHLVKNGVRGLVARWVRQCPQSTLGQAPGPTPEPGALSPVLEVLPGSPHKPPTVLKAQTLTADKEAENRLPLRGMPAQHPSARPFLGDSPELRPARQTRAEPSAAAPPERWTQSTGVFEYCAQVLRNTPT
uniref:Uncharacterized protein n=1 Tax=Pipistrellus kuhlii TaxID=59472 RepID=A0A7J7QU13_PIPKU|nr:hypothetical protein mPipKuh1_008459 [Pipistrellus kuhlii]